MKKKTASFDPSGVGVKNGRFIGLPFSEEDARIVLLPVPWDVTVSFADGTATAAQNILECSYQLDLYDTDAGDAWKTGIYMRPPDMLWLKKNKLLRKDAVAYIHFLESGGKPQSDPHFLKILKKINRTCEELNDWVYEETRAILKKGKKIGIVGGDHSVPLGYIKSLSEKYNNFGILQIDAHQDLRKNYEGFTYSHASIFYNILKIKNIAPLIQTGIRDHCEEEMQYAAKNKHRVRVWTDHEIKRAIFNGSFFHDICKKIIAPLPHHVYISFDIDGLSPDLCPHTGTPVPGGFSFQEVIYLIKTIVDSGREIIGFDLCETAGTGHEWDGNVGARLLYKLCVLTGLSTPI